VDEVDEIGFGDHAVALHLAAPDLDVAQRARGDVGLQGFDRAAELRGGLAWGKQVVHHATTRGLARSSASISASATRIPCRRRLI
jgi:hypothetical protein